MGTGVHAQGAADRAGNAAIEFEAGDARLGRRTGQANVGRRRSRRHLKVRRCRDLAKRLAAEPDDDAGNAAVANDEVRAEANHGDGNFTGQARQEIGEVFFVGRLEQQLRRAADAKPGERRQRRVGAELAAERGGERGDRRGEIGEGHDARPVARGRAGLSPLSGPRRRAAVKSLRDSSASLRRLRRDCVSSARLFAIHVLLVRDAAERPRSRTKRTW